MTYFGAELKGVLIGNRLTTFTMHITSDELPAIYLNVVVPCQLRFPEKSVVVYRVDEDNLSAGDERLMQVAQSISKTSTLETTVRLSLCETIIGPIRNVFSDDQRLGIGGLSIIAVLLKPELEERFVVEPVDVRKRLTLKLQSRLSNHNRGDAKPQQEKRNLSQDGDKKIHVKLENHKPTNFRQILPKAPVAAEAQVKQHKHLPAKPRPQPVIDHHNYQFRTHTPILDTHEEDIATYFTSLESLTSWKKLPDVQKLAYQGSLHAMEQFVDLHSITQPINLYNRTAYHIAAFYNWPFIIKTLASRFPDFISSPDNYGCTPLHIAARCGNFKAVAALIECGASIFARTQKQASVYHFAVLSNFPIESLQYLYSRGLPLDWITSLGATVQHYAVHGPQAIPVLEWLVTNGSSLLVRTYQGDDLLMTAAAIGNIGAINFILSNSDTYNHILGNQNGYCHVVNSLGSNALHIAAASKYSTAEDGIKAVAKIGISLETKDVDGLTPLAIATIEGHTSNVKTLLSLGADPCMRQGHSPSLLELPDTASAKLSKRLSLTPLHLAIVEGSPLDIIELFASSITPLLVPELTHGYLALHFAVVHRRPDIIERICKTLSSHPMLSGKLNTILESRDNRGCTALHLAVFDEYEDEISVLIRMGASVASLLMTGNDPLNQKALNCVELAELYERRRSLAVLRKIARRTGKFLELFQDIGSEALEDEDSVTETDDSETDLLKQGVSRKVQNSMQRILAWTAASSGPSKTTFPSANITTSYGDSSRHNQEFDSSDYDMEEYDGYNQQSSGYPDLVRQSVVSSPGSSSPHTPMNYSPLTKIKKLKKLANPDKIPRKQVCKVCRQPRNRDTHFVERRGVFHCLDESVTPAPHVREQVEDMRLKQKIQKEVEQQMLQHKQKQAASLQAPPVLTPEQEQEQPQFSVSLITDSIPDLITNSTSQMQTMIPILADTEKSLTA